MRSRINTANRFNTRGRINTANRINTRSRINTANRFNMLSRFNMPNRFVHTQHSGYGVGSGIVSIPNRFTIHGPITIRTTGTLAGITAVADKSAVATAEPVVRYLAGALAVATAEAVVVDTPAVDIAAVVVEDTPVGDTPVVVTVAIGNGGNVRISFRQPFIAC